MASKCSINLLGNPAKYQDLVLRTLLRILKKEVEFEKTFKTIE